jgi:hypothetical protein
MSGEKANPVWAARSTRYEPHSDPATTVFACKIGGDDAEFQPLHGSE